MVKAQRLWEGLQPLRCDILRRREGTKKLHNCKLDITYLDFLMLTGTRETEWQEEPADFLTKKSLCYPETFALATFQS